jgi:LPXTG-motif cell wall-anchored protein
MRVVTFLLIIVFFLYPQQTFGDSINKDVDLSTSPGRVLFDITNIKPGDSVIRNLKIYNNGASDFNYIVTTKFLSGSELFYNQLNLEIQDSGGLLYKGKLNRFKELEPSLLKSKQSENLILKVKIPLELGNEYQGLNNEFQIKLYVEGTLGGILPANGPKLPETGTNMFNYLAAGAVMILGGCFFQFSHLIGKKLNNKI